MKVRELIEAKNKNKSEFEVFYQFGDPEAESPAGKKKERRWIYVMASNKTEAKFNALKELHKKYKNKMLVIEEIVHKV